MRAMSFTKMQGLGNDFIVVEGPMSPTPEEVVELCDRRFGIGADGLLVITRADPIFMAYWNADGSEAEMCGNGLRCLARYAYDRGWAPDRNFGIQTPVGLRGVRVLEDAVEAEIGRPVSAGEVTMDGAVYHMVDVGNPHAVTLVDDPASAPVTTVGPRVERDSHFDRGTNVEFVALRDHGVDMRVWERGVGETLACGTGMVAAAYVAATIGGVTGPLDVHVPGGKASVELRDGVAWLRGPVEYSFRGSVGER